MESCTRVRERVYSTYISSIELRKVNVGIEVANSFAAALGLKLCEFVRRTA
jgi:hypothetical protein